MKNLLRNNAMMLLFFASSLIMLVVAIAAGAMMLQAGEMIEDSTKHQMAAYSQACAALVTGEELDAFLAVEDMQKPGYQALRDELDAFAQRSGLMYAYYMRLDPQTDLMQFIVDNVQDPAEEPDGLDSEQQLREPGPDRALQGEVLSVDLGSYSTGWDGLLTGWAPVYYSDGRLSNMVAGVDMQDVYIKAAQTDQARMVIILATSMILVLATGTITLAMYRRKARQSEMASEAKSSFLSRMSHEMRTPMNAIIGLSAMARESDDIEIVRHHLGNIEVSAQHLRRVIDDVLDISKIESGKMVLEFIPTSLRAQMEQVERIIRPQTDAKGQRFTVTVDERVPDTLLLDAIHLRQVVVNLLSNAIKFTPEDGSITLSVSALVGQENRVNLGFRVKDSGIGISEADIQRLFVAFEQGDASTTRKYGGTGLGLTITKQLIEMMGGEIRVQSVLGEGSEFIFDIWADVAGEAEAPGAAPADAEEPVSLAGRQVLLVEDSEMNQMIAVNLLQRYGAQVDIAEDGEAGLAMYLESPGKYDLIFMDIQMPRMDGYEATRRIRNSGRPGAAEVPIVAMTASVFREDVERAMAAGMNAHMGKPIDIDQVEAVIRKLTA